MNKLRFESVKFDHHDALRSSSQFSKQLWIMTRPMSSDVDQTRQRLYSCTLKDVRQALCSRDHLEARLFFRTDRGLVKSQQFEMTTDASPTEMSQK